MRRQIKLTIVACPNDPDAVISYPTTPGHESVGPMDLICGNCELVLVKAIYPTVYPGTIRPIRIIRCPKCRSCNEFPVELM